MHGRLEPADPQDCRTFADALAAAAVAGVCFGVGDGHDEVPVALLDQCRRHGLPVLIASPSVPFSMVSRFVAEYEMGAEIAVARATYALVPELLSALRRHASADELLDTAGQILGCRFLLDPDGGPPSWIGGGTPPEPALLDLIARFVRATQGNETSRPRLRANASDSCSPSSSGGCSCPMRLGSCWTGRG